MSPQGPQARFLPDGKRLHLHHGPIDLILGAEGPGRDAALRGAAQRFDTVLDELVGELDLLRRPVADRAEDRAGPTGAATQGRIARAMHQAVLPFAAEIVTPMAAVAGAVADEILRVMVQAGGLHRAYVNNGGDVAFHLAPGQSMTAAIAAGQGAGITLSADNPVRGVATSGWRGRSHSLGIADSVTVLAASAAAADAAATLIANRVDLPGHAAIARRPARDLSPDSDLGGRLVTVGVGPLTPTDIETALERGADFAHRALSRGLIHAAMITLGPAQRVVAVPELMESLGQEVEHA